MIYIGLLFHQDSWISIQPPPSLLVQLRHCFPFPLGDHLFFAGCPISMSQSKGIGGKKSMLGGGLELPLPHKYADVSGVSKPYKCAHFLLYAYNFCFIVLIWYKLQILSSESCRTKFSYLASCINTKQKQNYLLKLQPTSRMPADLGGCSKWKVVPK
jgi:hypothetical protein